MNSLTRMSTGVVFLLAAAGAMAEPRFNPFAGARINEPAAAPTAPASPSGRSGKISHLVLKAVIPMGNPPMANIDGHIVAVGEKVAGYILRSVGEQGVTLERGGRRFQLVFEYGQKQDDASGGSS
jgi:hypothetical protein